VDAACNGVTVVVQCARATGPGSEAQLRNLLEAAYRRGVTRVVHLSTAEVYGAVAGDVHEEHPVGPGQSDYARSKIAAEQVCAEYIARGLPLVVLRPTIVYGPFSEAYTVRVVERLLSGRWSLPEESCRGTCNLLYVDDLVAAIVLASRGISTSARSAKPSVPAFWTPRVCLRLASVRGCCSQYGRPRTSC